MKRIVAVRIGKYLNVITEEIEFQLQFRIEGERFFNGFSEDTFTEEGVKSALEFHNNGMLTYNISYSIGKYYICKAEH